MIMREYLAAKCAWYAATFPRVVYLGYNVGMGSRMYGTLPEGVPTLETPVAENLMMGMAVGMAMQGMRPVVCFERHDFLLLALDALVNHADKLPSISGGQYKLPILVRAVVGASSPIDPGEQHRQNYADELRSMVKHSLVVDGGVDYAFSMVGEFGSGVVVLVEHREDYDKEVAGGWKDEE